MAATLLLVESGLKFGIANSQTAVIILQNVDFDRKAKDAEATNEYGDVIGVAVFGGQRYNYKSDYDRRRAKHLQRGLTLNDN